MSIQRTDINGDIVLLKAALETLVPDFFATVELDDAESPTTVICKDADGNTLFTVQSVSGGSVAYTAYKNATTSISGSSTQQNARLLYFYKVGDSNAAIQCPNGDFIVISKTNTSGVGFAIPENFISSQTTHFAKIKVACWGDDPALDSSLTITGNTGATMIGNHCLLVPIPLHGVYGTPIYLPHAFFLPMAQDGMRGTVQQLQDGNVTYLTNGYIALMDH